jgi:hypothetical protein
METKYVRTIDRFFSQEGQDWEAIKSDLKPLVKLINNSDEEYNLQIRRDCFNIYYQGNSVAQVTPRRNHTYSVRIHGKFVSGRMRKKLASYSLGKQSKSGYIYFNVKNEKLHQFFQRKHLDIISGQIRKVHNGEEITMEQVIVTDNPPSPDFFIIDRQVADHLNWARIDLLALRRAETSKHHFVVYEIKLGRNSELREKAGKQVSNYVKHIREHIDDYAYCYEKNYVQKKQLGLFKNTDNPMPDGILIDREPNSVEGIVVAGGYSQLAKKNTEQLYGAIQRNGWDIRVKQMRRMLLND